MTFPRSLFSLVVILASASLASAQKVRRPLMHFVEVADTDAVVPGGVGTFGGFLDARDVHNDTVVFSAYDGAGHQGLYAFHGGVVERLVDQNTPAPNGQPFSIFFDVAVGPNLAVFTAGWPGGTGSGCQFSPNEGLFAIPLGGTTPVVLADSNNTSTSCFQGVDYHRGAIVVTGGNLAVDGFHNHQESILRYVGPQSLLKLVDTTSPKPGGGTFAGFDQEVVFRNGTLVFGNIKLNTIPPLEGVYQDDGTLLEIAGGNTPVPGGTGTFQDIRGVNFDGRRAAFRGVDGGGATALWIGSPGDLEAVVRQGDSVPGTPFGFLGFSNPVAFGGGSLLFTGYWSGGGIGLFVWNRGEVARILVKGDAFDGRIVEQAFAYQGQTFNDDVLLRVIYSGFSASGLYLARLPYPLPTD
jgi:hypothetical protein